MAVPAGWHPAQDRQRVRIQTALTGSSSKFGKKRLILAFGCEPIRQGLDAVG
jgi:hypothetical protein